MDFFINLQVLLKIYHQCFFKSLRISKKYWYVLFTLFAYALIYIAILPVVIRLGLLGGILFGVTIDACVSSFLVMVESMVNEEKIRFEDFKKSFWVYFFDVMGVLFVLFIARLILMPILLNISPALVLAANVTLFILFNPLPELIYQGRSGTLELYGKAYDFIKSNWIEWLIPNFLLAFFLYYLLIFSPVIFPEGILNWILPFIFTFFIYFFMIFRGLLFQSLHRSSRRARIFHYKASQ